MSKMSDALAAGAKKGSTTKATKSQVAAREKAQEIDAAKKKAAARKAADKRKAAQSAGAKKAQKVAAAQTRKAAGQNTKEENRQIILREARRRGVPQDVLHQVEVLSSPTDMLARLAASGADAVAIRSALPPASRPPASAATASPTQVSTSGSATGPHVRYIQGVEFPRKPGESDAAYDKRYDAAGGNKQEGKEGTGENSNEAGGENGGETGGAGAGGGAGGGEAADGGGGGGGGEAADGGGSSSGGGTAASNQVVNGVLTDTTTNRAAFTGPNGEPGYDPNDPNKPAGGKTFTMSDGRSVYYVPGTPSGSSKTDAELREQYGYMSWALDIPELYALLKKAAEQGYSPDRLKTELQSTVWWKTHSQAQRAWAEKSVSDPATTNASIDAQMEHLTQRAKTLGVNLSPARARDLAKTSLQNGLSDEEIDHALRAEFHYKPKTTIDLETGRPAFVGPQGEPGWDPNDPNKPAGGQINVMEDGRKAYYIPGNFGAGASDFSNGQRTQTSGTPRRTQTVEGDMSPVAATQLDHLKQIADQYLLRIPDAELGKWLENIIHGDTTQDAFLLWVKASAKSMWPTLSGAIDQGMTVRQFVSPYAGVLERELGLTSEELDWYDPKYQRFLRTTDPKTGQVGAMDLWQVQQEIRSNPVYKWDEGKLGRAVGAEKTQGLGQLMGVLG